MFRRNTIGRGEMPAGRLTRRVVEQDGLIRAGLALIAAGGLATLAFAQAYGGVMARITPELVLALNPRQPIANMVLAERQLTDRLTPAQIVAARGPAIEALRSQPLAPEALRLVALAAYLDRQEQQAEAVMQLAAVASKRDITTNLWLIDRSVLDEDVEGALRFFNRSLTLEPEMGEVLYPILAKAIDDPNIYGPAKALLARRPNWASGFYVEAMKHPPAARAIARMLLDHGNRGAEMRRDEQQRLLEQLANYGDAELAALLYRHITGSPASELVRKGNFGGDNDWPPFDWELFDDDRIEQFAGADGLGLAMGVVGAQPRRVARQLLTLQSGGRYRLAMVARLAASEGPKLDSGVPKLEARLACAVKGRGRFASLTATPARSRIAGDFAVPGDCPAQWLTLYVQGDDSRRPADVELQTIAVAPRG